jgi:hypothetical protein
MIGGKMNATFVVNGIEIKHKQINKNDYICLTDMAKFKAQESFLVISHWMRTRNTIDSWRGFHTPPLWGGHKGMKPESNTFKEQHTSLLCGGVC